MNRWASLAILVLVHLLSSSLVAEGLKDCASDPGSLERVENGRVQDDDSIEKVEDADRINQEDAYDRFQKQAVQSLLRKIENQFELDPTSANELRQSLQPNIKEAASRIRNRPNTALSSDIERQLLGEALDAIENKLDPSQISGFQVFREDLAKLNALVDQNSPLFLVVFLDNHLSLTKEQFDQLYDVYQRNWDPVFNIQVGNLDINGPGSDRPVIHQVPDSDLQAILTDSQWNALENFRGTSNLISAFNNNSSDADGRISTDKFREICHSTLDLKIQELERTLDLTTQQIKRLNIAKKGATRILAQSWAKRLGSVNPQSELIDNLTHFIAMSEPILFQATSRDLWQSTLQRTLTPDQWNELSKRNQIRYKTAKKCMLVWMANTLFQLNMEIQVSYEQHLKLLELLDSSVTMEHIGDYYGTIIQIVDIEDEKFRELLTDKQWDTFKAKLEDHRNRMAPLREQLESELDQ